MKRGVDKMDRMNKGRVVCTGWDMMPTVIYSNCILDISRMDPSNQFEDVLIKMLPNTKLSIIGKGSQIYPNLSIELTGGNVLELHTVHLVGSLTRAPLIIHGQDNHIYPCDRSSSKMAHNEQGIWADELATYLFYVLNDALDYA